MTGRPCAATRANGAPCGGYAIGDGAYCFAHAPDQAVQRDAARRRGGQAGRVAVLPASDVQVRSLGDVVTLVEATINDVRTGRVDVRVANAVGYLANVAIRALEQADLEVRLEALESVLTPERQQAAAWRRRR